MATDGSGGETMGPAELKPLLLLSKRKPVPCAVGLTKQRQGVILLHKRTKPRKLMAELLRQAKGAAMELDRASVRFGRVNVDGGSDSSTVHVSINKEAPGALRMALVAKLRPAGFQHCEISVDAKLEDEGDEDEPEEGAAAGDGAAPAYAPPSGTPSQSGAAPPGAAPPGAAALRARLTGLVRRAVAGQAAGPGDPEIKATALAARDALASGDLAAAGQATDRLATLLGPPPPPAPDGPTADPLLTPARSPAPPVAAYLAPAAPSALDGLAGRALAVVLSAEAAAAAAGTAFVAILVVPANTRSSTHGAAIDGHPDLSAQKTNGPGSISGILTIRASGKPGQPPVAPIGLYVSAPASELRQPGGAGPVLGKLSSAEVSLTPAGEAYLLARIPGLSRGQAAVPPGGQAGAAPLNAAAGGNTGRLPPVPPGNVRLDGECDEDENLGPRSPKQRLPGPGTGAWRNADGSDGRPGDSLWVSTRPEVQAVTGGRGIPFINGRPDLTAWAKESINLPYGSLTGHHGRDYTAVSEAMSRADPNRFPTPGDVTRYIDASDLTPHHATDTCVQLVPAALNRFLPHIGSAADMRANSPAAANQGGQP